MSDWYVPPKDVVCETEGGAVRVKVAWFRDAAQRYHQVREEDVRKRGWIKAFLCAVAYQAGRTAYEETARVLFGGDRPINSADHYVRVVEIFPDMALHVLGERARKWLKDYVDLSNALLSTPSEISDNVPFRAFFRAANSPDPMETLRRMCGDDMGTGPMAQTMSDASPEGPQSHDPVDAEEAAEPGSEDSGEDAAQAENLCEAVHRTGRYIERAVDKIKDELTRLRNAAATDAEVGDEFWAMLNAAERKAAVASRLLVVPLVEDAGRWCEERRRKAQDEAAATIDRARQRAAEITAAAREEKRRLEDRRRRLAAEMAAAQLQYDRLRREVDALRYPAQLSAPRPQPREDGSPEERRAWKEMKSRILRLKTSGVSAREVRHILARDRYHRQGRVLAVISTALNGLLASGGAGVEGAAQAVRNMDPHVIREPARAARVAILSKAFLEQMDSLVVGAVDAEAKAFDELVAELMATDPDGEVRRANAEYRQNGRNPGMTVSGNPVLLGMGLREG
jgi:cell division septum initiation protein DivIVA